MNPTRLHGSFKWIRVGSNWVGLGRITDQPDPFAALTATEQDSLLIAATSVPLSISSTGLFIAPKPRLYRNQTPNQTPEASEPFDPCCKPPQPLNRTRSIFSDHHQLLQLLDQDQKSPRTIGSHYQSTKFPMDREKRP